MSVHSLANTSATLSTHETITSTSGRDVRVAYASLGLNSTSTTVGFANITFTNATGSSLFTDLHLTNTFAAGKTGTTTITASQAGNTNYLAATSVPQTLTVNPGEQAAFARAALALKYDPEDGAAPVTESQLLMPRRFEDRRDDLWTTFNRVQENLVKGGLQGRNRAGRATTTRPVQGIDQNVKLNRALWLLAEEMRRLKA